MTRLTAIALGLSGAGLALSALVAARGVPDAGRAALPDPVLSDDAAFCGVGARDGSGLFRYYQRVAVALNEVRPFPSSGPGLRETAYDVADPPLWDNLGTLSVPITTSSARAQRYFDQGLRLAFAFNHAEARRAFRKAQRLDPDCALCWWGGALVLGPNINAPMAPEAQAPALAALGRAEAAAGGAGDWERALIAALARRYSGDPQAARADLDAAYAAAMGEVAARFSEADHIQVLYAEALMDLSPWNYWESGGSRPKGRTAEIVTTLERVLERSPDHAGAIHLYIHTVEASAQPECAEPYARRLGALMPGAGHLVHMPFHIYFRLGQYRDAIEANRAAVAADRAYLAEARPEGMYPQAYHPHNLHSLMVSAQMAGDGRSAVQAAQELSAVVTQEAGRAIPWVQSILLAPYFTHAQFSAPEVVLSLPDVSDGLPYVKAMWHYARGVAHAFNGDVDAARGEAEAIARLGREADFSELVAGGVPAPDLLALARHVVLARAAQSVGDLDAAQDQLEQAVLIQDGLGYTEPPHWYYPVRQSLGAIQLMRGDLAAAEETLRQSLLRARHNAWALYGLKAVYERAGRAEAAAQVEKRLAEVWAGGDRRALDLARL
jgi:tetratricopeptide (TPR) repeat protein